MFMHILVHVRAHFHTHVYAHAYTHQEREHGRGEARDRNDVAVLRLATVDLCKYICTDMRIDTYIGMCVNVYADVCVDMP